MTPSCLRRLALAFASFIASVPLCAASLGGRVLDSEGKPVGGAAVSWFAVRPPERELLDATKEIEPSALGEIKTDSEGRFRIPAQKPGAVSIRVLSPGLPSVELEGPFDPSEENEELEIPLPAPQRITGRVVDESGKAVVGARVRVQAEADAEEALAYAETKSGSDGGFSLETAPENASSLKAYRAGFAPADVSGRSAKDFAVVPLKRGGGAEGRVLDASGMPVAHAIVEADDRLAAETDAEGRYRFEALPEKPTRLRVIWSENLLARRDGLRIRRGEVAHADLKLAPSAGITGVVLDEKTRRPIGGVRVAASKPTLWEMSVKPEAAGRTDSRGRFRILGLLPSDYMVTASGSSYVRSSVRGVVAGVSPPGSVSIALRKAGGLAGRVTSESGSAVSGARVRIVPGLTWRAMVARGTAPPPRPTFTAADGTFRLRGLVPTADVSIEASREGFVPARRDGVPVRSGETTKGLALVLRRGVEARGRVVDLQGNAIAGAEIRLVRVEAMASRALVVDTIWTDLRPAARSGPDGRFTAGSLQTGQYKAQVARTGFATKTSGSLEVKKEDLNEWAPFILSPSAAIAGVIRNKKAEPVSGARVDAFSEGGASAGALSDLEGRFRLEGFLAGQPLFVSVWVDGYGRAQQTATAPSENLVITLTTAATVKGRVEDAETRQAIETFHVDWRTPRGGGGGTGGSNPEFHAADGTFELTGVRPGKVELEATAEGYLPGVSALDLGEGETKPDVVLSLKKGRTVSGRVLDPVKGTGVANASVHWRTSDAGDNRYMMYTASGFFGYVPNATTSDSDGKFAFDGLPSARLQFTASHSDFLETSKTLDTGTESSVELTLSAGGSIAGTVVEASGHAAVPGASVSLSVEGGAPTVSSGDDTISDSSGKFQFSHLKEGRYRLLASGSSGRSSNREVILGPDQSQTDVQLEIAGGTLVRGQVTNLPAAQLGGIHVFATSAQPGIAPGNAFFAEATSDERGQFLISNVPAGALRLGATISWPGRSVKKSVEIPAGAEEFPVEIAFEGSSRLSGRVTRHDTGVSGLHGLADPDPPSSGAVHSYALTDGDGRFAFEGLTDGNYRLNFSGESVEVTRSATVSGDTSIDIPLLGTTLSGTVNEASSGDPLAGVTVRAENGKDATAFLIKAGVSDSAGRYSITDLDPDNYQVTARKDGYASKTQPVSVGDSSSTLDFALAKANGLAIHATDAATGLPLAGIDALVLSGSGASLFGGSVSLDATGRGEISSLSSGSYTVRVFSAGYAPRMFSVSVPSPAVEVAMTSGGRVAVRTDSPVTGKILDASGNVYISSLWRTDGIVNVAAPLTTWESFAPGSYVLAVQSSSGDRAYSFVVTEGRATTVELK